MMNQAQMMGQVVPPQPIMSQNPAGLVQPQGVNQNQNPLMMINQRAYKPRHNNNNYSKSRLLLNCGPSSKPRSRNNSSNWKGNNVNKPINNSSNPGGSGGGGSGNGGYKPPSLQTQNRMKARKYYRPKKKLNNRFAPYAPRNTTSFIIRAKKSGGIASLVSPCPVTPAVLLTPIFSPSGEVLGDMAKEEWGVDGYGSMKGLIRLRSPGNEAAGFHDKNEEVNGARDSDVEEHVEVERRLDHDLSRFEMIYPN